MKIGNYKRTYFSKKFNHTILGLQEGGEYYTNLKSLVQIILPALQEFEKDGIDINFVHRRVEVHFVGDMPFLLKLLGIKTVGCKLI
jgi:hypothetical protein